MSFAGRINSRTSTADPCGDIPGAKVGGENSDLGNLTAIAVSGDGKSVNVTTEFDISIVTSSRNTSTDALSFVEFHRSEIATGYTDSRGGSTRMADGTGSGLSEPFGLG